MGKDDKEHHKIKSKELKTPNGVSVLMSQVTWLVNYIMCNWSYIWIADIYLIFWVEHIWFDFLLSKE